MKKTGILFALLLSLINTAWSQCTWTSIFYNSYEYTTAIPYIIPGTTYQNTPQTYPGCVRTGTRGMYLNIVNGFTGLIYSQPFTNVCVGQNYRFSFSTRDAFASTNNLTFNVYDNSNVLLSTQTVINGGTWNDITMPAFTATTTDIRFEIVTNLAGGAGNDAGFDDLRLFQCQPDPVNYTVTKCFGTPVFNLYAEQTGSSFSNQGAWTGPTALQNGYLGTFDPAVNTNGTYTYTISGAVGCADTVAHFNTQLITTPAINPIPTITGCENAVLPAIAGSNITAAASYYTGTNGTGTAIAAGTNLTASQTLYAYDGITGCSDQETVTITISQPNNAGNDNSVLYCTPVGVLDLNTLLNGNTGAAGSWTETTVPPSGAFNAANGQFNTSAVSPNDYTFMYTVPASGACSSHQAIFTVSISGQLSVDLGNDTTFCQGQGVQLDAGVHDNYLWDNNSTSQTRYASTPGQYYVRAGTLGNNMVVDGDFESGTQNFSSSYVYGTGGASGLLTNPGQYAITTSPNLVRSNFSVCQDHTPAPGTNMLVVNGAGTANTNVWCQTVNVQPNMDYQFGAWVSSALTNANPAQLQLKINGTGCGTVFSPSNSACQWSQLCQVWSSNMAVSAQVCLVNQNTNANGNDFSLDDISFAPICYAYDTIVISNYPNPVISVSPNDTICAGETATFTGMSGTAGLVYTWMPGGLTGSTVSVSPAVSTVYSVTAVSPAGCVSNSVSSTAIVHTVPQASILINGNDTICKGLSSSMDGSSTIPGSSFLWSTGGTGTQETVSPLTTTVYSLQVTSGDGCVDDTSVTLYVIPDLSVNISGNTTFCEGSGVVLSATSNQPGMQYTWNPSGSHATQLNVSSEGWVYLTGDYFSCPPALDSVLITEAPNPVVIVPEGVEICPGEPVDVTVSSDQPGSTFTWMPGNLSGSTNTLTVDQATTFYVFAQNGACVSAIDSFVVAFSTACFLEIPNVFTPNADDINDYFELVNHDGIQSLSCVIVNRWGNTIREFDSPAFKWDGLDESGATVSEGVYFYRISAVTDSGQELNKQGMVEVIY